MTVGTYNPVEPHDKDTHWVVDIERGPTASRTIYPDNLQEAVSRCIELGCTYVLCALEIINHGGVAINKTEILRAELEKISDHEHR